MTDPNAAAGTGGHSGPATWTGVDLSDIVTPSNNAEQLGVSPAGSLPVVVVGSLNLDIGFRVSRIPRTGETVLASSRTEVDGGKGGNQAVAAARLGAQVTMVACVGDDAAGVRAVAAMQSANVAIGDVHRRHGPTGSAIVLVGDDSDNAIIVSAGGNDLLTPADAAAAFAERSGGVALISLEIPLATAEAAAVAAAAAGFSVVVNPAPAQQLPAALLAACDVLVPNEHEVTQLGAPDIGTLLAAGVGAVVVTRGSQGVDVYCADSPVHHVAAWEVHAVDTTGAGDAFCGALGWALSERLDLLTAVELANAAGGLATERVGARARLSGARELTGMLETRSPWGQRRDAPAASAGARAAVPEQPRVRQSRQFVSPGDRPAHTGRSHSPEVYSASPLTHLRGDG